MGKPSKPHDTGYKLLFSDPLMVRDLVQGFIADPWLQKLDFSTLEAFKGHYVTEDLRDRADDVVWRVKSGEDWVYLYLLIEFQSGVDRYMSLRMLVYVGLLYQDLIKQKQIGPSGLLPPVLPIVLYNGRRRWRMPTSLSELLPKVPPFLAPLQPQMRYVLIDEGAYSSSQLNALPHNVMAAIFKLEQLQHPEEVRQILTEVLEATKGAEYAQMRRIIALWLRATLKRNRRYSIELPELDDLQELSIMLSQRIEQWAEAYMATGQEKGRLEGRLEGQASLLSRLLEHRFGELPVWAQERLNEATESQLAAWSEAVLDAESLAAVFEEPPASH